MKLPNDRPESVLDRYIQMNLKLVDSDLGIGCVLLGTAFCFLMSFIGIFLMLPLLGLATYFIYKALRKLMYDSVFGKSAYLFQALPMSPQQLVLGKIFTGGLVFIITAAVSLAIVAVLSLFIGNGPMALMDSLIQSIIDEGAETSQISWILAAEVLASGVAAFREAAIIFAAVVIYQTLPAQRKKWFTKILVILAALAVQALTNSAGDWVFEAANLGYNVGRPLLNLAISVVVLIPAAKLSIMRMEKKYQLA